MHIARPKRASVSLTYHPPSATCAAPVATLYRLGCGGSLVLGKHSGKAAYRQRLIELGYEDVAGDKEALDKLVADAKAVPLERAQLDKLRAEEGEKLAEKMRRTREREAQMAAEESDDEIVFSDEEDDEE